MDLENKGGDHLEFQHLVGGDIVKYAPLYAPSGEHLFLISGNVINVYSTATGRLVRRLEGATSPVVDMEVELKCDDTLVACSMKGELLSWLWRSGQLKSSVKLAPSSGYVTNFKLLNLYGKSELSYAFVCQKPSTGNILWYVVNRSTGNTVNVRCDLKLWNKKPLIAVDNKNFPNLVLAQGFFVYFINYKSWVWRRYANAHKVPVTALQKHPSEECFATGDELGKIMLWREFSQQKLLKMSLYHWHHTPVTSIAFSASGANFFSGGHESVLVKWNVEQPELRHFIPRLGSIIRHIAVSPTNVEIAVCTADNSVHIVGSEHKLHSNLQEFTYIDEDKTQNPKFPVGLRLNPRTNTLVLNGRIGHLQFYNTYTRNFLYNLNIVNQNMLSTERGKILYDIRVTKAAFNIDWLATGEVFNDEQHLPELRLKFWKYQEESQSYALNTNVELPHEGGFRAIEFSNNYQVDNLLCATVGEDNVIKIWSLEESDNIYNQSKVWFCISQTSYKNMSVGSVSFSQDGSLLAAGFGNTLCIYKADSLKLKAALTGTAGMDGCVQKAQVRVSTKKVNGSKPGLVERRKKLMQLFSNLLESNEEALLKEIQSSVNDKSDQLATMPLEKLDDKDRTMLYNKILQMHELNLFQKLLLYQKLGLRCEVHPQWQTKLLKYIKATIYKAQIKKREECLSADIHRINMRSRFKAKYRLQQYTRRKRNYDDVITKHLVPIMNVLSIGKNTTATQLQASNAVKTTEPDDRPSPEDNCTVVPPVQGIAEISHVQFAAGDYGHLVTVCTERRVLIWNLLTLRLQSVLKLSVQHLSFDPQTNLLAAVTKDDELHVFQPNVPLPIYQRRNLPKLHGIAWIPRRHPKQRSINLDWQAQSTLYFLTEDQEILFLAAPNERQSDAPPPVIFDKAATELINYSTFGTYATKTISDKETANRHRGGPLVLGNSDKSAVKALIEMSTHTMPPLNLVCESFIKSMVKLADTSSVTRTDNHTTIYSRLNGDVEMNGHGTHSDTEDDDDDNSSNINKNADDDGNDDDVAMSGKNSKTQTTSAIAVRKQILAKAEELSRQRENVADDRPSSNSASVAGEEKRLRQTAAQNIQFEF